MARITGHLNMTLPVDHADYRIFTTKYVLFAYAIQTRVTFTYRGTISRKPYVLKN